MPVYEVETDKGVYEVEVDDSKGVEKPKPSGVSRFASTVAGDLNPVNIASGLINTVTRPLETAKSMFTPEEQMRPKIPEAELPQDWFHKAQRFMGGGPNSPMMRAGGDKPSEYIPEALGHATAGALTLGASRYLPRVAGAVRNAIPSAERAGQALEQVTQTVGKNTPVDTTAATRAALRARELSTAGFNQPKIMKDVSKSVLRPGAEPITFGRARDMQSAAGKLSVAETQAMKGPMAGQVKQLAKALAEGNQAAADAAGVGPLYRQALTEYRRAMRMKKAGESAVEIAQKAAITAVIGSMGYAGFKALTGD